MKPPKIDNQTEYDGRSVGKIVRFVFKHLDLDGSDVLVRVRYHNYPQSAYVGRIYYNAHAHESWIYDHEWNDYKCVGPKVPSGIRTLIICRIAKPGSYPRETHVYDRRDAPDTWIVADWKEALVSVVAHEAQHLRQFRFGKRGRGRFNEVDTEWAARRLWAEWCARVAG